MKTIRFYVLLITSIIVYIDFNFAMASEDGLNKKIASTGDTAVAAKLGKTQVLVKFTTHEVDIGKGSQSPEKRLSSCTYSRYPCSLVDYLEIIVDGNPLFVPRSVYADLADINEVGLRLEKGKPLLILSAGDASENVTLEILFDSKRIKQRVLKNGEFKQVLQKTIYYVSEDMNN